MSKPLLILVHGSGLYADDWADQHVAKLDELAGRYPGIRARGAFTELVDVETIRYDDIFQDRLDTWEALGDELDGFRAEIEGMDLSSALAVRSGEAK